MGMDKETSEDVLDYVEWPTNFKEVTQFESSLFCQICGDFFQGPVVLPCSHTFCSECVRKFMLSQGLKSCCPECRKPSDQRELVANRSLGNVIELYRKLRPKLQELAGLNPKKTTREESSDKVLQKYNSNANERTSVVPLPFYKQLKDKAIRDLLCTNGLPASGSRDQMIATHKQFVLLLNAQRDATRPKSKQRIVREIKTAQEWSRRSAHEKNQTKREFGLNMDRPSEAMSSNFEKLKSQIAQQREQRAAVTVEPPKSSSICESYTTPQKVETNLLIPSPQTSGSIITSARKRGVEEHDEDFVEFFSSSTKKPRSAHEKQQTKREFRMNIDRQSEAMTSNSEKLKSQNAQQREQQRPKSNSICESYTTPQKAETNLLVPSPQTSGPVMSSARKQCVEEHDADFVEFLSSSAKKQPKASTSTNWQCQKCTLVNTKYDLRCSACDTRRG